MPNSTYSKAVRKADLLSKATGRDYFVVDDGSFSDSGWIQDIQVASDRDLDGFYAGLPEHRILYCSSEGAI